MATLLEFEPLFKEWLFLLPSKTLTTFGISKNKKIYLPETIQMFPKLCEFAEVNSILYCSAEGAYTKVVFIDKRHSLLISRTLGDIEEMLPPEIFVRIHHSTIVNINAVTHYIRTDGGYVIMNTDEKLMVSKSRKETVMKKLGLK
ncbi:MAG TPA: LytTR family transcriptional regulator DNA-binding domain-containing protein [Puia sp.]|nr:LytTR family transcriptional regulator DNA-binding domain-containing protein [Puia sp.]